ncbi:MAG: helix-turn-helix domain-containing protein [Stackebrandtia sp.]
MVETRSRLTFGDGYALYRGRAVSDIRPHRHAAFQIAVGTPSTLAIVDDAGTEHRGAVLLVPPGLRHRMVATGELTTAFIDPHCVLAGRLRQYGGNHVAAAPELACLTAELLRRTESEGIRVIDGRLLAALSTLERQHMSMLALSASVGLSPQRLRALARRELGIPLVRWYAWQRLARAVRALERGQGLAAAAVTAGFADQAHLTRNMRGLLGITPLAVRDALTSSPTTGDIDRD